MMAEDLKLKTDNWSISIDIEHRSRITRNLAGPWLIGLKKSTVRP